MRRKIIAAIAACLAFQGELLAGKRLLPEFGGCAYVWCGTILFFQLVLIWGYYGSRSLAIAPVRSRRLILAGLGVSGLSTLLPFWPTLNWLPQELQPVFALLPFAGLSMALFCTTPLLHSQQDDPMDFSIYAWSNAGAFVGLLSYPLLIEPWTGLRMQTWVWALGGLWVCLIGLTGGSSSAKQEPAATNGKTRWQWWVLPALNSAILLATTNQLTYEASAGPLTWALPLAVFLGSYIWAFSGDRSSTLGILSIAGLIALAVANFSDARSPQLLGFVLLGGGVSMAACNIWLAATRNANTSGFYRASAIGGAAGSAIVVMVIPRVATGPIEYPVLVLGTLAVAAFGWSSRLVRPFAATLAVITIGFTIATAYAQRANEVARGRNLYGCLRVIKKTGSEFYSLYSSTTVHGAEDRENPERGMSYYKKETGLYRCVEQQQADHPMLQVGVIGLGTGSINHLLRPQDSITYYEINPMVEEMARKHFTYLRQPATRVVIGDGRKCLESEHDQKFDVLVLDAFSGDAIPLHLLTREAGCIFKQHLKSGGVLAFHITNAHVDLHPVVEGLAESMGMGVEFVRSDRVDWAIIRQATPASQGKGILWTDDRNSVLQVCK